MKKIFFTFSLLLLTLGFVACSDMGTTMDTFIVVFSI